MPVAVGEVVPAGDPVAVFVCVAVTAGDDVPVGVTEGVPAAVSVAVWVAV